MADATEIRRCRTDVNEIYMHGIFASKIDNGPPILLVSCCLSRSLLLLLHFHLKNAQYTLRVILFPFNRLLQRVEIALDK